VPALAIREAYDSKWSHRKALVSGTKRSVRELLPLAQLRVFWQQKLSMAQCTVDGFAFPIRSFRNGLPEMAIASRATNMATGDPR
jgi:hypothetical protein